MLNEAYVHPVRKNQFFVASTEDTVSIGNDPNNPSMLAGLVASANTVGFIVDAVDGSVINATGRTMKTMLGTINFQPNKTGGGTSVIYLWSERSADGVTWVENTKSLRTIEINNNGESFKTTISGVNDWENGDRLRFRAYTETGTVDFVAPTANVLNGEVITGASVTWELKEV